MSTRPGEDDVWRSIVDNYGERAELDDADPDAPEAAPEPSPEPFTPTHDEIDAWEEPEERFVPPVPPPAPRLPLPQRLAWLGVFGSPAVLLVALVAGIDLPGLVAYGLVTAFIGGFLYLVATMQRGSSRDPWDDGSRI